MMNGYSSSSNNIAPVSSASHQTGLDVKTHYVQVDHDADESDIVGGDFQVSVEHVELKRLLAPRYPADLESNVRVVVTFSRPEDFEDAGVVFTLSQPIHRWEDNILSALYEGEVGSHGKLPVVFFLNHASRPRRPGRAKVS